MANDQHLSSGLPEATAEELFNDIAGELTIPAPFDYRPEPTEILDAEQLQTFKRVVDALV